MTARIQLYWAEHRRMGDAFELHFVEATETGSTWKFHDTSLLRLERCDQELSARLQQVAEYGKRAILAGVFPNLPDLHLKRIAVGDSTKLSLAPRESQAAMDMVLAIVHYRRYCWRDSQ
jgi:hypothetical protein